MLLCVRRWHTHHPAGQCVVGGALALGLCACVRAACLSRVAVIDIHDSMHPSSARSFSPRSSWHDHDMEVAYGPSGVRTVRRYLQLS